MAASERRQYRKDEKDRIDVLIGRNIRLERQKHNIEREELAEMIQITPSHLGLIERGERGATAVTLTKLTNTLGVPIDTFFHHPDERGETVREEKNPQVLKLQALASVMSDQDLDLLVHVAKGIIGTRGME